MKAYKITFHRTYRIKARNEEIAVKKAHNQFIMNVGGVSGLFWCDSEEEKQ